MTPCTVTATFQDAGGNPLQGNAFLRIRLRNYSGYVPKVVSLGVLVQPSLDFLPNSLGVITANIWGNDNVTPPLTFYTCEFWVNGKITFSGNYNIIGSSFNLNTQPPLVAPNMPYTGNVVITNPVSGQFQTINQPGGSTLAVIGTLDLTAATVLGIGSVVPTIQVQTVAFSATPTFAPTTPVSSQQITLTGNVTGSTFNSTGIAAGSLVTFKIIQDGTGGRTFVWPVNFKNATVIGSLANQTTMQLFYWDGTNAYALSAGTII